MRNAKYCVPGVIDWTFGMSSGKPSSGLFTRRNPPDGSNPSSEGRNDRSRSVSLTEHSQSSRDRDDTRTSFQSGPVGIDRDNKGSERTQSGDVVSELRNRRDVSGSLTEIQTKRLNELGGGGLVQEHGVHHGEIERRH